MTCRYSWHVLAQCLAGRIRALASRQDLIMAGSINRSTLGKPKAIIRLLQATPRLDDPRFESFSTN